MKSNKNFEKDLLELVIQNFFSFTDIGFLIKVLNGPFLYANDSFYKNFKNFIKVKNIVGKNANDIFDKNREHQFQNDNIFLKKTKHISTNYLFLSKKDKIYSFYYIKFKLKNLPIKFPINKKMIGIIIFKSTNHKINDNNININKNSHIRTTKISKLIKSVKEIYHLNKKDDNKKNKLQNIIQQIKNLSNRDFLTNLYNRSAFEDIIKSEYEKSFQSSNYICLLLIDIDDFKSVNDNFGHMSGDAIIKELSKILIQSLRKTDYVARWGGEEFAVILPRCNLHNAQLIADKILKNTRKKNFKPIKVTVSIGVAQLNPNEDITSWFIRADNALIKSKKEGKNRFCIS